MSETIYFPDGRVEVRFDGPIEPLELHTNLPLEEPCGRCDGTGFSATRESPCPVCDGCGTHPTRAGQTILWFLRRHWDGMPLE